MEDGAGKPDGLAQIASEDHPAVPLQGGKIIRFSGSFRNRKPESLSMEEWRV
jgi:hypothetical protein